MMIGMGHIDPYRSKSIWAASCGVKSNGAICGQRGVDPDRLTCPVFGMCHGQNLGSLSIFGDHQSMNRIP